MASETTERTFYELVTAAMGTDDSTLLKCACIALGAILTEYSDRDEA